MFGLVQKYILYNQHKIGNVLSLVLLIISSSGSNIYNFHKIYKKVKKGFYLGKPEMYIGKMGMCISVYTPKCFYNGFSVWNHKIDY